MDALDGNAIGGLLFEAFGIEMTTASFACAHCGARGVLAEAVVYLRAPGAVVRCRGCGGVLMVMIDVHGTIRTDQRGLAELTPN